MNGDGEHTSHTAFDTSELGLLDAVETANRIRAGELTKAEVVEAAINRADRWNPLINAAPIRCDARALEDATSASSKFFAGVPTFIKGLDDVAGLENTRACRAFLGNVPKQTDPLIQSFLDTGLVNMGLSAAAELGLIPTTETALYGATRNPWNLNHTPGGSSGGAAALVASGVVPIAHATDGGGSIRIPAAMTGLVGLKVSRDRNLDPPALKSAPLRNACHGVVTRTVRDTATFLSELEQVRPADGLPPVGRIETPSKRRLRIGFYSDSLFGTEAEPDVAHTIHEAAEACRKLGHDVSETKSPLTRQLYEDVFLYWSFFPWYLLKTLRAQQGDAFDESNFEPYTVGLARYYESHAEESIIALFRLRAAEEISKQVYSQYDVLLSPVIGMNVPELGWMAPDLPFEELFERTPNRVCYTQFENITGDTAISLPLGLSAGNLPVGVQFAARSGDEATLLSLAYEIEAAGLFVSRPV